MPRRLAATFVAAALTAGPAVLMGAEPAYATGDHGTAGAVVLRTGLNVKLLNKALEVPLHAALNEVQAPASAHRTALTVDLDGINQGKPFSVLRADVATARATTGRHRAEGYARLVHAKVHAPGLGPLSLIEVQQVTSRAVCEAGKRPRAESNVLGSVLVLGKKVTLRADGTTDVRVPGVGEVRLDLSRRSVTGRSAAATALELKVAVNPLKLNVADVRGRVTLAEATCKAPEPGGSTGGTTGGTNGGQSTGGQSGGGQTGGSTSGGSGGSTSGGSTSGGTHANTHPGSRPSTQNLAETGGSSATPYLIGGAALLVGAGAGTLGLARRRRAAAPGGRG
ncbi:SCO1860 family LAETG-anchored protein [Streptomyces sp. NPDC048483]|uniref:SCO1860 family LAETG-anchored protein n=1 Tax=Streptomyces sp. NPDC048483 TaxID=3154927 RepID=UPI00341211EC